MSKYQVNANRKITPLPESSIDVLELGLSFAKYAIEQIMKSQESIAPAMVRMDQKIEEFRNRETDNIRQMVQEIMVKQLTLWRSDLLIQKIRDDHGMSSEKGILDSDMVK